jgi:hypothetical protein
MSIPGPVQLDHAAEMQGTTRCTQARHGIQAKEQATRQRMAGDMVGPVSLEKHAPLNALRTR